MASHDFGKPEVCEWIRANFPEESTILDVGACDGKMKSLLPEYANMDAVEIWKPNADRLTGYRKVICKDIEEFKYRRYDLIIFGDVIEHMEVEKAQKVLEYAKPRCKEIIVAVPYLYPQGEIYGNPYEKHLQPDLTAKIFNERYPGFEVLLDTGRNYCFYRKATK